MGSEVGSEVDLPFVLGLHLTELVGHSERSPPRLGCKLILG